MPRKPATKPLQRTIDVLDLGFEDAQRLRRLASKREHRNKRFMGIEWVKRKGLVTRGHNLKLVYGDAFNRLKRLASESVKIVTADFLFTEYKVGGLDIAALGWRGQALEPVWEGGRRGLMKQVKRVLVPNGRFVVVEYAENIPLTLEGLEEAGFKCTVKPVPREEMGRTYFLKTAIPRMIRKNPALRKSVKPMRIIARKK